MVQKLLLVIFYEKKNYMETFQLITFHIKLQQIQNHCVLGSTKLKDLFIISLDGKIKHLV